MFSFFIRFFTFKNFLKIISIFSVGLLGRVFINEVFHINVFVDYSNTFSIVFYAFMSVYIVFINEFFYGLDFCLGRLPLIGYLHSFVKFPVN